MKPVVSFKEKCEWIQRDSQFELKMAELELKSKTVSEKLQRVAQKAQNCSQSV